MTQGDDASRRGEWGCPRLLEQAGQSDGQRRRR
jgi:hypothetical protein